ncbi:hypothetical protein HDE_07618 [Halotydeus destructor]|nr:hypothetical protein HDE_07618 [Halotydeus destructor]
MSTSKPPEDECPVKMSKVRTEQIASTSSASLENRSPMLSVSSTSSHSVKLEDALKSEQGFMDYVLSLPTPDPSGRTVPDWSRKSSSLDIKKFDETSSGHWPPTRSYGWDKLDNLCKLMEQLGHLKEANSRLRRKLQALEDLKSHQSAISEIIDQENQQRLLKASLKDPILSNVQSRRLVTGSTKEQRRFALQKSRSHTNASGSSLKRQRSKSVGHEELLLAARAMKMTGRSKSTKRFPKWSRFMEAIGWDTKPDNNVLDEDETVLIRPKSRHSYSESRKASRKSAPTPTVSSTSGSRNQSFANTADLLSIDDSESEELVDQSETASYASNDDQNAASNPELRHDFKSHKGAWSKVKTIIQTRKESIKKRKKHSSGNEGAKSHPSIETEPPSLELSGASDDGPIRMASLTERKHQPVMRRNKSDSSLKDRHPPSCLSQGSKTSRKKPSPLDLTQVSLSITPPSSASSFVPKFTKAKQRTPEAMSSSMLAMSPPVARRSKWNRMKKVFANAGEVVTLSPSSSTLLDYDLLTCSSVPASPSSHGSCTFDIVDEPVTPVKLSPSTSGQVQPITVAELQRNLSSDFSLKMLEWEKIRAGDIPKGKPSSAPYEGRRKGSLSKFVAGKFKYSTRKTEDRSPPVSVEQSSNEKRTFFLDSM